MALARQEGAVRTDPFAQSLDAAFERIGAIVAHGPTHLVPFISMRRIAVVAPGHAVDLEKLVPPLLLHDAVHFAHVIPHLRLRRVQQVATAPVAERLALVVVQKPAAVLCVKNCVTRAKGDRPDPRTKSQSPDIVGQLLHSSGELSLVGAQVQQMEVADRQVIGVALPRFDRPDFQAKGPQLRGTDACLRQVLGRTGPIEVHVPAHPTGRWPGAAFPVDRRVVGDIARTEIVRHQLEYQRGTACIVHARGQREGENGRLVPAFLPRLQIDRGTSKMQGHIRGDVKKRVVEAAVRRTGCQLNHLVGSDRQIIRLRLRYRCRSATGKTAPTQGCIPPKVQRAAVRLRGAVMHQHLQACALSDEVQISLHIPVRVDQRQSIFHAIAR